ncbi:GGDEF domain-containing protein [Deinococcus sp.]|uniref:GGDEF domain-containing protein n=1 Tax=Deinococcus sp. TaxID=47478 RepID=UPI0025DE245A|nr:GGDEF domain-containing protein [Deinococcus sp.]
MPPFALSPEFFSPGSRRKLLLLTLLLIACSLLGLVVAASPAGLRNPALWWPLALVAALTVLAAARRVPVEVTVTLGLLVFLPVALLDLQHALRSAALPSGLSLWTPALIVEVFLFLGSRTGLVVVGLVGALLLLALSEHFPASLALRGAWLNLALASLLLTVLGYTLSSSLERSRRMQASSRSALALARQDALTGLMGRAALEDHLERSLARALRHTTPLSLLVCDIDHFKAINDRHGHSKGDEVLRSVARRLARAAGGGVVGRWGGEEFLVVVPLSQPDALAVAERMRADIAGRPLAGLNVTVSLGAATHRSGENVTTLFARADQHLYEAKRAGRNRVR